MSVGLDVIVVDDEQSVCKVIASIIKKFYVWGDIVTYSDVDEATSYCLSREIGVAIFVVDVFLGEKSGFLFLDSIEERFPSAHKDAVIISGMASDDIVNMCLASDVNYLLEKPVKPYALQLALRAITGKYLDFTKKLMQDSAYAESVARL